MLTARTRRSSLLWHFIALALASAVMCRAMNVGSLSTALALAVTAATVVVLAPLFWPGGTQVWQLVVWCCAATALVPALESLGKPISSSALAATALTTLLLLALVHAVLWFAASELARALASGSLLLLGAAPVWLGPLAASHLANGTVLGSWAVACSPLIHLSVAAGADVLRTPWLYTHSPLGSMRVDYPSFTTLVTVDSVLALLACAGGVLLASRRDVPASSTLQESLI